MKYPLYLGSAFSDSQASILVTFVFKLFSLFQNTTLGKRQIRSADYNRHRPAIQRWLAGANNAPIAHIDVTAQNNKNTHELRGKNRKLALVFSSRRGLAFAASIMLLFTIISGCGDCVQSIRIDYSTNTGDKMNMRTVAGSWIVVGALCAGFAVTDFARGAESETITFESLLEEMMFY